MLKRAFQRILILFVLVFSFQTFAAPIPEGAVFWVTYVDRLQGNGDRMMAVKLADRISNLGYTARVLSHTEISKVKESEGTPTAIINVPDQERPHLPAYLLEVPFQVIREAGYRQDEKLPALGLNEDTLGMLLDQDLMDRYTRSKTDRIGVRFETFNSLTPPVKESLRKALGISEASTDSDLRSSLENSDVFLSYAYDLNIREGFAQIIRRYSQITLRKSVLVAIQAHDERRGTFEEPRGYSDETELFKVIRFNSIPHEDFKNLVSLSHAVLVTGDRSLEEAISAGVPFFYEVLDHKDGLARQIDVRVLRHRLNEVINTLGQGRRICWAWIESLAQSWSELDRESLYQFFDAIHRRSYLTDVRLKALLERTLDQGVTLFKPGMTAFEINKTYLFSLEQVCALQLGYDGKLTSQKNIDLYHLSPDHHFESEDLGNRCYLVRLVRP